MDSTSKSFRLIGIVGSLVIFLLVAFFSINGFIQNTRPIPKGEAPNYLKLAPSTMYYRQTEARLQHLTDLALQVQSLHSTIRTNRENVQMQTRGFYVVILSVLLAGVFGLVSQRNRMLLITMVVVILMYVLDVSWNYDIQRMDRGLAYDINTVQALLSLQPSDSALVFLDYTKSDSEMQADSDPSVRWHRKYESATAPSLIEIILYLIPLGGLSLISLNLFARRKFETKIA
jgi:hypothetical protein